MSVNGKYQKLYTYLILPPSFSCLVMPLQAFRYHISQECFRQGLNNLITWTEN
jgi:hypothetical protein